jgi:hypothetical protein
LIPWGSEATLSQGTDIHSTKLYGALLCTRCCDGCPEIWVFASALLAILLSSVEKGRENALEGQLESSALSAEAPKEGFNVGQRC